MQPTSSPFAQRRTKPATTTVNKSHERTSDRTQNQERQPALQTGRRPEAQASERSPERRADPQTQDRRPFRRQRPDADRPDTERPDTERPGTDRSDAG